MQQYTFNRQTLRMTCQNQFHSVGMPGGFVRKGFLVGNVADAIQRQRENILQITPLSKESDHPVSLITEVKLLAT